MKAETLSGQEIEQRFTYRAPSGNQPQRYEVLRSKAKELAALANALKEADKLQEADKLLQPVSPKGYSVSESAAWSDGRMVGGPGTERRMGLKLVNCDCRQPGFPRHTHTHPLGADGKMVVTQGQDKEPGPGVWPFSPAKGKTPKRPFLHWPLVWLLVGLALVALVALKIWLEYHQKVEIELP